MNIVCLNCEVVVRTEDPRKRFCGKVCRNRFNVQKTRSKPKKEKVGVEALREMIKRIENKPKLPRVEVRRPVTAADIMTGKVTRGSISRETYQKDEWVDPI